MTRFVTIFACVLALAVGAGWGGTASSAGAEPAANKAEPGKSLDIYFVDIGRSVGNATILVSPTGECVMLDAGPGFSVRRVVDVLKQAGVKQVDYLVNTHYHN